MGIGSVTSMNMSGIQLTTASSTDSKNKNIKKEITDAQQEMRALSSKEELSVNEKANEKKTLQKKISSLNTELKQHQEELRKSQKREIMMAELQEEQEPAKAGKSEDKIPGNETSSDRADKAAEKDNSEKSAKTSDSDTNTARSRSEMSAAVSNNLSAQQAGRQGTVITRSSDGIVILKDEMKQDQDRSATAETKSTDESKEAGVAEKETKSSDNDKDTGLTHKEIQAIVSSEASAQQAGRQGTVIARIENGIAILKGEINQDEKRGIDTEKKQAELKKMEQREQRAREFQSSALGEANSSTKSAEKTTVFGAKDSTQANRENNIFTNASKLFQREIQASQQNFFISLDS